ncbi:MAG: alkaline phosphatase [Verrucomicrobia bacterium]|nr:alkaline phosphatase [Verrucomicrobiota bacterium]
MHHSDSPNFSPSRRDFFKRAGVLAAAGAALPGMALDQGPHIIRGRGVGKAKNIIFMVSDGMSSGTLSMADQLRVLMEGRSSNWIRSYRERPVQRALMDTSSANNLVTDSAAASSVWGCGQKMLNGRVNTTPDGDALDPILLIARRNGLRTGLVTTTTVTHATPAGFAANGPNRGDQPGFAVQYFERGYDVILGGGRNLFSPAAREDRRDLISEFEQGGHTVISTRNELLSTRPAHGKMLGLFAPGNLPYEIDRLNHEVSKEEIPSLAEMTSAALELLSQDDAGFLVQIEGARVDHAAHTNDISGLLFDQLAFDDAIGVALDFCERHPDTLLIFTTDHGNANPGLEDGGRKGENTLAHVGRFTGSMSSMNASWGDPEQAGTGNIRKNFYQTTRVEITDKQAGIILAQLRGEWVTPYRGIGNTPGVVGQILAEHLRISWIGGSHTSDHVELAAMGPGSERIKPFVDNTDLFTLMVESLGLRLN